MGGLFDLDGPFAKVGNIIGDIFIMGLLWSVASIPIFTIGAATTATFYVSTKRANKRDGYIWKEFWRSFRQNFKKATAIFMIIATILTLVLFNIFNSDLLPDMHPAINVAQFFVLIQVVFITMYIFALLARFDMGIAALFRTSFFMANRHFLTTLQNIAILIAVGYVSDVFPPLLLVAVGAYCYISSYAIVRMLKKHKPDMDADPILEQMAPLPPPPPKLPVKDEDSESMLKIDPSTGLVTRKRDDLDIE